jgi:hypothetical protein
VLGVAESHSWRIGGARLIILIHTEDDQIASRVGDRPKPWEINFSSTR